MLYVYRAVAYDELGRLPEALLDLYAALEIAPAGPIAVHARVTLALVRRRIGDLAGALDAAREAIATEPNDREAHALLGTLLAWNADYPAAWPELECHWLDERITYMAAYPDLREWDGEDIRGKRLLLVHGQGLGDMIQTARYLPQLRARCERIIIEAPAAMIELMQRVDGVDEVVAKGDVRRETFDVFARMMTLPRLLGETGAAQPGPYLFADPDRVAAWAPRLPEAHDLRVGLVWAGNPFHQNDRRRTIPIGELAPLASVANVRWFSLQVGPRASDDVPQAFAMTQFGSTLVSMADTAAVIANLDLVISVDTAVAHLAGALGTPVWLALPWRCDWRWQPFASTSPWYPSMTLVHAIVPSWTGVVAEMRSMLEEHARPR